VNPALNAGQAGRPLPAAPRAQIFRERLSDRIHHASSFGIGLMVAPAGFGKTEVLRSSFEGSSAALIEFDDHVQTVEPLLQKLVSQLGVKQVRSFASLLQRTPREQANEVFVPWVASRLRTFGRTIVIDDLQYVLRDPRAAQVLQTLIESTHPSVNWFLSSRETPELPVGTWIARGWMHTPLSPIDLAFTEREIQELADAIGIPVGRSDVTRILADTAGWPIAVQLSLVNWQRTRAPVPGGIRTRDVLFSYIDEQIWSNISTSEQQLLEIAALLPRPRLALLTSAGYGSAGLVLDRLARRVNLIEHDDDGEYRLHNIFRDFINERHRLDGERHKKAVGLVADALTKLALHGEALRFFTDLHASPEIIAALERCGYDMIESGERSAVTAAISALSGEWRSHPVAAAIRGWLQMLDGAYTNAEADMERALAIGGSGPFAMLAGQRMATFLLNRGNYRRATDLLETLLARTDETSTDATELNSILAAVLAESGEPQAAIALIPTVIQRIGDLRVERRPPVLIRVAAVYYRAGRLVEAEAVCNEAAVLAAELGLDGVAATAFSVLYSIAEESHPDTESTDHYAHAMGAAAANAGDKLLRVSSLERLLYTATVRGDDKAIEAVERELLLLGHIRLLRDTMQTRVGKVMREVGRGHFRQAERLLETIDPRDLTKSEASLRDALYALVAIASNEPTEAAPFLSTRSFLTTDSDYISRRSATLARIYRGLAHWLLGQQASAKRALAGPRDALTRSDEVLASVIIDICASSPSSRSPEFVAAFTDRLVNLGMGGHARFLERLIVPAHTTVTLTKTELALLRSWRVGDTIQDLAQRLGRSPNTVNSHMGAIYRKTGAATRHEALLFAKDHGLIP
jgi:ATP/maltotriose-dependent transcriptional regulator MalT